MRHVAPVALALLLLALPPAMSSPAIPDDCAGVGATGCREIDVPATQAHPAATYYLYVASVTTCGPTGFSTDCNGAPFEGDPPVGLFGLLYQETNAHSGLQRSRILAGTTVIPADTAILL